MTNQTNEKINALIEKRTNKNTPQIIGVPQNLLIKEFYRDLQSLIISSEPTKKSELIKELEKAKTLWTRKVDVAYDMWIDIAIRIVKHLPDSYIGEVEMNKRDNELAILFNTTKWDKWDLYMKIIEYLVKKWFLQKW